MRPSRFCQARVPRAAGSPPRSGCSARIRPAHRFRRPPFMPFVTHIGPQAIDLRLADPIVFQQGFFDGFGLPRRRAQPIQNRIFLNPFGTRDTADAHTFGQQSQRFQDRLARRLTPIEHCAVCFRKCLPAALAPITLRATLGFSEANDLPRFDFAVQLTLFVWAKLPHLSRLFVMSPSNFVPFLALFYQQHSSGRLPKITIPVNTVTGQPIIENETL